MNSLNKLFLYVFKLSYTLKNSHLYIEKVYTFFKFIIYWGILNNHRYR